MDEKLFLSIKNEYTFFRKRLEKALKNSPTYMPSEDCCFIDESYIKELENCFSEYSEHKTFNGKIKSNLIISYQRGKPRIINYFSELINYIKSNKKIRLINRRLIELIDSNFSLNNYNLVQYYAGNNKIIIEFKNNIQNRAILIVNPLNEYQLKSNIFIIVNNQEKYIYTKLLSDENMKDYELDNKLISNINNFIPFEKYFYRNNTYKNIFKINHLNEKDTFKKDLLKVFIYLFFYDKFLSENNVNNLFYKQEKYYLINPNWLKDYKIYYNYDNLYNKLIEKYKNNISINYNNIEIYINNIVNQFLNKDVLNFDKDELSQNLIDMKKINCFVIMKYEIKYIFNGVIIPSKIIDLIKKWNKKIIISPKEIYFKRNDIFYINNLSISIGNLNYENIFIKKYIFIYNSIDILKSEKVYWFSNFVNEYIKKKKYFKSYNELKNEENEIIGKLIILSDNNRKIKSYSEKKINNDRKINKRNLSNNKYIFNLKYRKVNDYSFTINNNNIKNINKRNDYQKSKSSKDFLNTRYQTISLDKNDSIYNVNSIFNFKNNNNEYLLKQIQEQKNEIDELKKKQFNMQEELNKQKNEIINLKKENNKLIELKEINTNLQNELNELKNKINEYEKKEEEKKNNEILQKNNLEKEIEELEKNKQQLIKDIENIKKNKEENDNLIQQNSKLQNEINSKQLLYIQIKNKLDLINNNNEKINNNIEDNSSNNKTKVIQSQKNIKEQNSSIIEPLLSYNSPTLIGLNNIGAAYFMNSILQCLSQTKELTNYFLKEIDLNEIQNDNEINNENETSMRLSPIYQDLIQNLWKKSVNKGCSYLPYTFKNLIEKMKPIFKKGNICDPKDFIDFILNIMHNELKIKNKNDNNNILVSIDIYDKYDKKKVLNNFLNDFEKETSIISKLFFGIKENTNICLFCKNNYNSQNLGDPVSYNYEVFNYLIFSLEEVYNSKKNSNQNNNINNEGNIVSIYDCFNFKQNYKSLINKKCDICQQKFRFESTSKIYESPYVLILIFTKDILCNIKLDFNENLDITEFVLQKPNSKLTYSLYGIIINICKFNLENDGHFIALCKSPIDNKWYKYNDSKVELVSNFQKEIIELGNPYILFYKNIN